MSSKRVTKKKKSPRFFLSYKIIALVGIALIFISISFHVHRITRLSFAQKVPVAEKITPSAPPTFISIPSIEVYLPIEQTAISNGIWEIAESGVSHLRTSANPEDKGTVIMYAHNTPERFGRIGFTQIGDEIRITSKDGKIHRYTVGKIVEVKPTDIDALTDTDGKSLVVYTCSGFADTKRLIVKAFPVK